MRLGDRIKTYERAASSRLLSNTPVFIRVDGRAFHTFMRSGDKPFDQGFINAMVLAAQQTAEQMQGFKMAYIQSDEVTFFLSDMDRHESDGWFNQKVQKIVSLSAAAMSVAFNAYYRGLKVGKIDCFNPPLFDSRAFNVPPADVVNAFLWRGKDWERNSLQMYARAFFSHKELHEKNTAAIHEMLHKIGKNWATDLNDQLKNGTFLVKCDGSVIAHHAPAPSFTNYAKWMHANNVPAFCDTLFDENTKQTTQV